MTLAMATITDLPYALLYHIIFLLVQSSGGAADLARIISVCRNFLPYAEDVSMLRVVNFHIKMESMNFYHFQCVKGLLVKCSEAGNVTARHVLGKVILLSSSHLFLSERQKVKFYDRLCDHLTRNRILDTNVPAQNRKVSSFMTYFSPIQVYSSEVSPTRLVHYELVNLFLLNGSHQDFIEMDVFLKYCIKYFMGVTGEDSALIASIELLVQRALRVRLLENLPKTKESFNDYFRGFRESFESFNKNVNDPSSARSGNFSDNIAAENDFLLKIYLWKCDTVGVNWREAVSDVNFVEALREDVSAQINEAYTDFSITRAETLDHFERKFG